MVDQVYFYISTIEKSEVVWIERFFGWLKSLRRIQTRYERLASTYLGFIQLGCNNDPNETFQMSSMVEGPKQIFTTDRDVGERMKCRSEDHVKMCGKCNSICN